MAPQVFERPPERRRVKLCVFTPCYGCMLSVEHAMCVLRLQESALLQGVEIAFEYLGNESLVQRARNIQAAKFLQSDGTHMLFLDADIAFDPAAVFRMLRFLETRDQDIATAIYPKKNMDWDAVARKSLEPTAEPLHQRGLDFNLNPRGAKPRLVDGFLEVSEAATGFMMLRRGALERMASAFAPTLTCVNDIPGQQAVKEYVAVFDCMIDPDSRRYLSEDYAFCRRWASLGGTVWADLQTGLCHIGGQFWRGDLGARVRDAAAAANAKLDANAKPEAPVEAAAAE